MVIVKRLQPGPMDCNMYLLSDGSSSLLVDAGTGSNPDLLLGTVKGALSGSEIRGLILTHEHFDHVGGAAEVSRAFECPVYGSRKTAEIVSSGDSMLTGAFLFGERMAPVEGVDTLGDRIGIGAIDLRVERTPGHSPGSVSLMEEDSGYLFCGDLLFSGGGVGRWDLPGGDLELLKDSVKRSLGWDVRGLYPGHGPVETEEPKKHMRLTYSMIKDL